MKYFNVKWLLMCIIILQCSCTENDIHYLDKSNLILFEKGDSVVFNNNINANVDTFLICTKNIHIDRNEGYNDDYEVLNVDYCLIRNTDTINFINRYPNTLSFGWFDLRNNVNYNEVGLSNYPEIEMVDYVINNITIQDVYKLKRLPNPDTPLIVNVFYTHLFGVIAYEYQNGELYEIDVTRLPEKPE